MPVEVRSSEGLGLTARGGSLVNHACPQRRLNLWHALGFSLAQSLAQSERQTAAMNAVRLTAKLFEQDLVSLPRKVSHDQSANDSLPDVWLVCDRKMPEKDWVRLAVGADKLVVQHRVRTVVHQVVHALDAQPEGAKFRDEFLLVEDAPSAKLLAFGFHLLEPCLAGRIVLTLANELSGSHAALAGAHLPRRLPEEAVGKPE